MTERGLPIVDAASACPFVAFEDDRDERSIRPDHRHRCYAEVRPAPRALAHQEAYCLAPAFPACPTFQDWARREAARARPVIGPEEPPGRRAVESGRGIDRPPAADADRPARSGRRDWALPPPWAGGPGIEPVARGEGSPPPEARGLADAAPLPEALPPEARGLADAPPLPEALPPEARGLADAPAFLVGRERAGSGAVGRSGAPSGASSPAGIGSPTGIDSPAGIGGRVRGEVRGVDDDVDDVDDEDAPPASGSGRPRRSAVRRPSVGDSRPAERSLRGPSWERPQRFEAYPTLKTRMGMPDVPRVAVGFAALIIAALALFFIPPLLIRPSGDTGAAVTPTPTGSVESSASLAPTPIPSPTPQTYAIAPGDTLSKVAKQFGITLADLLAANPSIKNPDKVSIGQEIVIPVPAPSVVVDPGTLDGGSPAPSSAAP